MQIRRVPCAQTALDQAIPAELSAGRANEAKRSALPSYSVVS